MENLLGFAESFPPALQWLAVMLVSAIPFVESYFGTFLGILTGVPVPVAMLAAIIGNGACMLVLVLLADAGRKKAVSAYRARKQAGAQMQAGAEQPGTPYAGADMQAPGASGVASAPGAAATGVATVPGSEEPELSPRRQKLKRAFDRYGVAGVSIFGQAILPSQITSAMMVGFGASRNAVIVWQIVGITLWSGLFALLALGGVNMLAR
ncbi:hypothetical protein [Brevibacterium album]|uniref:hypothetical protein n=1 Tax=Brevibacterium album TaxID=417948 RepID=UPI000423DA02|nr:hypothetical protein [Brevibacterium album]